MTQAATAAKPQQIYRPKLWQSAIFGLVAGALYLVLAYVSQSAMDIDTHDQYYAVGVMMSIGVFAWQWRSFAAIMGICVLGGAFATSEAGGYVDPLGLIILASVMLVPFALFDLRRIMNNILDAKKFESVPPLKE